MKGISMEQILIPWVEEGGGQLSQMGTGDGCLSTGVREEQ
jgi:hypothetical protein